MSRIIVSGSLAYDRIMDYDGIFAEHVLPEKANSINLSFLVDKLSVEFGGTAGNIAYNLALLGEKADIIATAGQDFAGYKSHLLLSGIETTSVRMLEGEMTSSAYVFTDKDDNQIAAFHPGAGARAYDTPINTDGRALAIVAPGCVEDMVAFPRMYRKSNVKYAFDPGQQTLALSPDALKECITGALIVFASDYELGLISQKTGWTEEVILQNTSTLVVTYGSKGSRVRTPTGEVNISPAVAEKVVDPTGAGDAYRAGFIKGMVAGFDYEHSARLGSVVASYCIEMYGTQNHAFTMEQLKDRYIRTYGDVLQLG